MATLKNHRQVCSWSRDPSCSTCLFYIVTLLKTTKNNFSEDTNDFNFFLGNFPQMKASLAGCEVPVGI